VALAIWVGLFLLVLLAVLVSLSLTAVAITHYQHASATTVSGKASSVLYALGLQLLALCALAIGSTIMLRLLGVNLTHLHSGVVFWVAVMYFTLVGLALLALVVGLALDPHWKTGWR